MEKRVLLLEDDINLSDTIKEYLEDEGYFVDVAYNSDEALEKVYEKSFDIFLLDVMVPGINGFELLKKIREKNSSPAIFITSLNSVDSLEKGYESGCDDYIRKPFALKELSIRIKSLLKKEFGKEEQIRIDDNIYYDVNKEMLYIKNRSVNLNQKERKLLKLFLKRANEPISHEEIFKNLWDYEESPSDMALRTYIKNLRKYLGKDRIESIKRYGYKFIK
jgi:DNA-binding response OmpR family regulator